MEKVKIAVIGGGSTYTPELVEGLIAYAGELSLSSLCLTDVDRKRLKIVGGLVSGWQPRRETHSAWSSPNQGEGCRGRGFCPYTASSQRAKGSACDTVLCLEEGTTGQETTSPAGFAKALCTIPVVLDICRDMRELAPNAWLIDFTNPSGIIAEAILNPSSALLTSCL